MHKLPAKLRKFADMTKQKNKKRSNRYKITWYVFFYERNKRIRR